MIRATLCALSIILLYSGMAFAGTAILEWDAYTGSPNFKELRVYRGSGTACGMGAIPLSTLAATIPKSTPLPTTYTDTAAPDIVGMLCYELAAVDLSGTITLESKRSNRALKMLESSVPSPTTLKVKP